MRKEVKGPKFGRDLLNKCKELQIPSSAYVVLLISLYECDQEEGILNKPSLPRWAETLGISYETLQYGWNQLLNKGIIREQLDNDYYQIVDYRILTFEGKGYFRVPVYLLISDFFQQLIKLKDWKSSWLLLHILYRISASPYGYGSSLDLTMNQLKKDLNRQDSYRIRKLLEILKCLYDIEYIEVQYRSNQVHLKKIKISLKKRFIAENIDLEMRKVFGQLSADVKQILVDIMQIHLSKEEIRDICRAFVQEVRRSPKAAREILFTALKEFGLRIIRQEGSDSEIENRPGYLRKLFRDFNFRHALKIDPFHKPVNLPL